MPEDGHGGTYNHPIHICRESIHGETVIKKQVHIPSVVFDTKKKDVKKLVKERYGKVAMKENNANAGTGCNCTIPSSNKISCCGGLASDISKAVGYSEDDLASLPEGANLGLGCGNPVAFASLKKGETMLDLGSGAGIDCFIATRKVGPKGKVIGIDMTHEMLEKARQNAEKGKYKNVEFRLGEIENIPVGDNQVDAVISNCVINLSPDKEQVFREAFRVLKPEGRLMVSDMVLLKEIPIAARESVSLYVSCIAGALLKDEYLRAIKSAGFRNIKITDESAYPLELSADIASARDFGEKARISLDEMKEIASSVVSIKVWATKPKR